MAAVACVCRDVMGMIPKQPRILWATDLPERFERCVARLVTIHPSQDEEIVRDMVRVGGRGTCRRLLGRPGWQGSAGVPAGCGWASLAGRTHTEEPEAPCWQCLSYCPLCSSQCILCCYCSPIWESKDAATHVFGCSCLEAVLSFHSWCCSGLMCASV